MKTLITRLYMIIAIVIGTMSVVSCDKMDDNGPFYGYWLLTDAVGPDGPLSPAPEEGTQFVNNDVIDINMNRVVTWGVRNELIMIRDYKKSDYYFFTFTRDANTLQLIAAYHNDGSNDTQIEFADIPAELFIPHNGRFSILTLDNKSLVLKADDITLTFKKN